MADLLGAALKAQTPSTALRVGRVLNVGDGVVDVLIGTTVLHDLTVVGSYVPLLDDLVSVARQGAAWLVLGSTSEPGWDWTPYIPTWTNTTTQPSTPASSWAGSRYRRSPSDGMVDFRMKLTWEAGTSGGTGSFWQFGFPVPPDTDEGDGGALGQAYLFDANVIGRFFYSWFGFSSTIIIASQTGTLVSQASPFTFTTGDVIRLNGRFRPAS